MIPDSKFKNSSESGYIALMSAIIIAGVLMAVVFSLSFKAFITRFNLQDTEYKKRSLSLAEACANTAMLKLIGNSSYAGETITFGNEECVISASNVSGTYFIHSKSSVPKLSSRKAISNIEVKLNTDFSINNWKECISFPNSTTCL